MAVENTGFSYSKSRCMTTGCLCITLLAATITFLVVAILALASGGGSSLPGGVHTFTPLAETGKLYGNVFKFFF